MKIQQANMKELEGDLKGRNEKRFQFLEKNQKTIGDKLNIVFL